MSANLLTDTWKTFDSYELRLLLSKHITGGHGQYDGRDENPNKIYLPLAGEKCRISLTFRGENIVAIEPGLAFDAANWKHISAEIQNSILAGPPRVGREYSFSRYRVLGLGRGNGLECRFFPRHITRHGHRSK